MIYQYALENLPEGQKENLYNVYTQFEKQYGSKDGLEDVIVSKRRLKYEQVSKHLIIGIITKSI
jgi:crooked neck